MSNSSRLALRWVRIVPHLVDSVLLASAIGLVLVTHQYPGELSWLNAKILALVLYIALGMAAFRRARTRGSKIALWVLSQLVFVYIVMVAVKRTPFVL